MTVFAKNKKKNSSFITNHTILAVIMMSVCVYMHALLPTLFTLLEFGTHFIAERDITSVCHIAGCYASVSTK